MATPFVKVDQVKLDVRKIIENLIHLEINEKNQGNLEMLQNETEKLLSCLESLPLEDIQNKLRKRKKRRHVKRLKKVKIREKQIGFKSNLNEELYNSSSTLLETPKDPKTKLKPHHKLKNLEECQRFLKTFELFEQLHLARGQNYSKCRKFSAKLQQLKSVWNCLLQEQQQEQTSTEQLWHEVLFGPPEKTYFKEKPNLQTFVTKRQIWDSHINYTYGSSIPTGWILPPKVAKPQWRHFLASQDV